MSNANRDYAIVYDVKNSSLALGRPLNFYITDKNTSNIFIKLVTRVTAGNGIDQYTDIENASNYVLTMRVIKPNNEVKSLEATQHEPENIFQFDLTEDFKDIPGKYICELTISTIVNSRQELITSDPFSYEVKRSILSNVGEIIETEDTTVEKLLNNLETAKAEFSSQIKEKATIQELEVERKRIDSLTTLSEGSTTGDAELIDARIGVNGVTYNNLGTAIRKQFNAIAGYTSSSNTLTIDDSFTGKIISVDITGFKGQVVEFMITCDNSVLADDYSIQIGITKSDGTDIDSICRITPNKTFELKLDYNIKKINAWIGSKLGNGDVVLTAYIKNIIDYTNELNDKIEKVNTLLSDNDTLSIYKVSNSVTIDSITGYILNLNGTFKKDEKINIIVDSDCINENTNIAVGITYPTGDQLDVVRLKPNSYVEFTPTDNATKIFIWIDESVLNSTGKVTLSVKNFTPLTDKIDEVDNKIDEVNNKMSKRTQGLSFSILGDSYSTYEGWVPLNNNCWYHNSGNDTPENDVASVVDTWWYKLSKDSGMSLLINDSYSGSTISTTGYDGEDATRFAFITRMVNTLGEKRTLEPKPNIIFIFGGANDSWAESPIGELKHSNWSNDDLKSFLPAFCYMISYIKKYNPQARIINITNTDLKSEISDGMSAACQYYNIENVVLSNISKTGGHPNKEGMEAIKNQIISIL